MKMGRELRNNIIYKAMKGMLAFDKPMAKGVIIAMMEAENEFSKELLKPDSANSKLPAWLHAVEFGLTICGKLGWFKKDDGLWSLTPGGRIIAHKLSASEFHARISEKERGMNKTPKAAPELLCKKFPSAAAAIKFLEENRNEPVVMLVGV